MLQDALQVPRGATVPTDICVVGGGAAGITIAHALAGAPVRVLLLESGGFEAAADSQALTDLSVVGRSYTATTRLRFLGGNTNHWGGHCVPLRPLNLERQPWSADTGWPFGFDALAPWYERAHRMLGIGPFDYDPAKPAAALGLPLFPFDPQRVLTVLSRYRAVRFGTAYRAALADAPNVTVCTHATVTSIHRARASDRIERVAVRSSGGHAFAVRAKVYVLASGGIENARLLLASNDVEPAGLGNRHDLVGRYFMEHIWYPSGVLLPAVDEPPMKAYGEEHPTAEGYAFRFHLALPERVVRDAGIPDFRAELAPFRTERYTDAVSAFSTLRDGFKRSAWPDDLPRHLASMLTAPGSIRRHIQAPDTTGPTVYQLLNYVEQSPNPDSRVTLGAERDAFGVPRARVDWRLSAIDRDGIVEAQRLIAAEAGRSRFGHLRVETDGAEAELLDGADGGYHHMGTTRMHENPRRGVVDANARVHGLRNLYVAGSSVFPSCGYANPTLTIVALSMRLAERLKEAVRDEA